MDLGSVIGMVGTFVLIIIAMILGAGVGAYVDPQSVLIVIGGSITVLMLSFKMEQVKIIGKLLGIAFKPPLININELIQKLVEYAEKARRDGILALEGDVANEENAFLKKGLSMAVDGNEPEVIRDLLEIESEQMGERHKGNAAIFDQLGSIAGSMGMIGTLVGLVAMLVNMSDPSAIGPAMAVAILTTLYGAVIGNTFGGPIANILSIRSADEGVASAIIIEGIMSIQAGDNPRVLEDKLNAFLAPVERQSKYED